MTLRHLRLIRPSEAPGFSGLYEHFIARGERLFGGNRAQALRWAQAKLYVHQKAPKVTIGAARAPDTTAYLRRAPGLWLY